mgnify:CR=1 FL=1
MNLSKENQTLLALLGYALFGRELTISAESVDWDQVVAEADRHAVTAFLYPGVKRLVKLCVGQIGEQYCFLYFLTTAYCARPSCWREQLRHL